MIIRTLAPALTICLLQVIIVSELDHQLKKITFMSYILAMKCQNMNYSELPS